MAADIIFEGFKQYNGLATSGVGLLANWLTSGNGTGASFGAGPGGTRYFAPETGGSGGQTALYNWRHRNPNGDREAVVGFRFYVPGVTNTARNTNFFQLTNPNGQAFITLSISSIGELLIYNSATQSDATLLLRSTRVIVPATWHYIEIAIRGSGPLDATGSVALFIDGEPQGEVTNIAFTSTTASPNIQRVILRATQDATSSVVVGLQRYTDMYFQLGSLNRLGDCRVHYLPVNEDIAVTWTPSTGTNNWATIDDLPASTTQNNSTDTIGNRDVLGVVPLGFTPSKIHGIGVWIAHSKSDVADRAIRFGMTDAADNDYMNKLSYLATTITFDSLWATQNPLTGTDFTPAELTGLRLYYELEV